MDRAWGIGHTEMDKQYQPWFAIFNKLEDAFLNGSHPNMNELQRDIIKEILDYVDNHFKIEENFMDEKGDR